MAAPAGIIQEHNLRGMAIASISSGKLLLLEKRHMTSSVALVNSSLMLTPYKSGSYSLDPGIISFRAQIVDAYQVANRAGRAYRHPDARTAFGLHQVHLC